jgi:hypothetical protein
MENRKFIWGLFLLIFGISSLLGIQVFLLDIQIWKLITLIVTACLIIIQGLTHIEQTIK